MFRREGRFSGSVCLGIPPVLFLRMRATGLRPLAVGGVAEGRAAQHPPFSGFALRCSEPSPSRPGAASGSVFALGLGQQISEMLARCDGVLDGAVRVAPFLRDVCNAHHALGLKMI